jgi:hypothetical protein
MIYRAEDKNNDQVNHRLMGQFCHFLNAATLQEAHLNGRLFTWSNEREHPTLERIDRFFFSNEWEAIFTNHELHSLASIQNSQRTKTGLCTRETREQNWSGGQERGNITNCYKTKSGRPIGGLQTKSGRKTGFAACCSKRKNMRPNQRP